MSTGAHLPPSFAWIATRLNIDFCGGIDPRTGLYCQFDHDKGTMAVRDMYQWMIHWRERRVGRAGVRQFLLLASTRDPEVNSRSGWRRTYLANIWAYWTALDVLNMRLPAALFDKDRAIVLAQLEAEPEDRDKQVARSWAQQ